MKATNFSMQDFGYSSNLLRRCRATSFAVLTCWNCVVPHLRAENAVDTCDVLLFFPFSSTSTLACYPALVLGLKYQTDTRKHPYPPTPPIKSKSHTPPAPIGDRGPAWNARFQHDRLQGPPKLLLNGFGYRGRKQGVAPGPAARELSSSRP